MKNLLTKGLFVCVMALCASCKEEPFEWPTVSTPIVFSFKEEVTIIEVDESVKSFKLEGIISDTTIIEINEDIGMFYSPADVDRDKTTARPNVHFIYDKWRDYDYRLGFNVYQEVELIPENIIGDGVEIVYYSTMTLSDYNPENFPNGVIPPIPGYENLILRTVIKLVPKKKQE